jgi:FimV-like protein
MSSIDLNLQPQSPGMSGGAPQSYAQPMPSVAMPTAPAISEDTENSKLNLAAQLLAKGDKDLARALILSVVSSSQGDLKARAVQLLGQIR